MSDPLPPIGSIVKVSVNYGDSWRVTITPDNQQQHPLGTSSGCLVELADDA